MRCNQDYSRLTHSNAHKYIRAKKIFVRDLFEVVDHRQLVGDCFSDFMEVTIKAFLKLKDEPIIEAVLPVAATQSQLRPASGKKFTSEPTSMKDVIKSIKQNKVEKNVPEKRVKLSET